MNDLHSNFTVSKSIESSLIITGEFVTDTLVIGDITVESMKIGVLNVDATQNILGLGYGEANSSFISLTEALVDDGTIKSPAFSMYMENPLYSASTGDSQDEKSGTLLFGGVNKSKYNGTLHTLPIVNNPADDRKAFWVNMTSLSINETSVFPTGHSTQALLDPSLSHTYVPESIAQDIISRLGATEITTFGPMLIPCNTTLSGTALTFGFGSASFKLDIDLFIETHSAFNEEDICYLGIAAQADTKDANRVVLGANFLQQIYVVYDMGNDEVSLAQRNWDSNEDEILEITTGKDAVPGASSEQEVADGADDTEAKDDSEKEKSIGFRIDERAGLQLSLSIFVIWAVFCL
ncbi:Peptidase A1 [Penicillium cf. griseofulvum]|nr:Peptidase A1 [Penicillium cf. griseofulvum]